MFLPALRFRKAGMSFLFSLIGFAKNLKKFQKLKHVIITGY